MTASYVLTLPVRVIFPLVAKVSFFAAVCLSSFPIHPECALISVNTVRRSREARNGTQLSRVATPQRMGDRPAVGRRHDTPAASARRCRSRASRWPSHCLHLGKRKGDDRIARRGIWVEPSLLAEIEYRAKSAEWKVRHPVFKGLREDV
jgi:hypothetical protein